MNLYSLSLIIDSFVPFYEIKIEEKFYISNSRYIYIKETEEKSYVADSENSLLYLLPVFSLVRRVNE